MKKVTALFTLALIAFNVSAQDSLFGYTDNTEATLGGKTVQVSIVKNGETPVAVLLRSNYSEPQDAVALNTKSIGWVNDGIGSKHDRNAFYVVDRKGRLFSFFRYYGLGGAGVYAKDNMLFYIYDSGAEKTTILITDLEHRSINNSICLEANKPLREQAQKEVEAIKADFPF